MKLTAAGLLALSLATTAKADPICICITCAFGPNESFWVTAGAMKPTLEPDDCVISDGNSTAAVGDVITYWHPERDNTVFVMRLIATAGQTVQMRDGILAINGQDVARLRLDDYIQNTAREGSLNTLPRCPADAPEGDSCAIPRFQETLGTTSYETLDLGPTSFDTFGPVTVPPDHVFVLGDHRDNAVDSRGYPAGRSMVFVPVVNIIGVLRDE